MIGLLEMSMLLVFLSMTSSLTFDVGCLNVTENDVTLEHCFTAYNDTLTQLEASDRCQSLGARLARITNQTVSDFLKFQIFYEHHLTKHYWIGAEMTVLRDWEWLNNQPYSSETFGTVSKSDQVCDGVASMRVIRGFYKWRTEISGSPCYQRPKYSYICQYNGEEHCHHKPRVNNTCIELSGNESQTWYRTRNKCLRRGGDLLTSLDILLTLLDRGEIHLDEKTTPYWIGLHKVQWKWTSKDTTEPSAVVKYTNWDDQKSPSSDIIPCVYVSGEFLYWHSSSCSSVRNQFLCERILGSIPQNTKLSRTRTFGAVVSIICTLLAVAIIAVVCQLCRNRKRAPIKREATDKSNTYQELQAKDLTTQEGQYTELTVLQQQRKLEGDYCEIGQPQSEETLSESASYVPCNVEPQNIRNSSGDKNNPFVNPNTKYLDMSGNKQREKIVNKDTKKKKVPTATLR